MPRREAARKSAELTSSMLEWERNGRNEITTGSPPKIDDQAYINSSEQQRGDIGVNGNFVAGSGYHYDRKFNNN